MHPIILTRKNGRLGFEVVQDTQAFTESGGLLARSALLTEISMQQLRKCGCYYGITVSDEIYRDQENERCHQNYPESKKDMHSIRKTALVSVCKKHSQSV